MSLVLISSILMGIATTGWVIYRVPAMRDRRTMILALAPGLLALCAVPLWVLPALRGVPVDPGPAFSWLALMACACAAVLYAGRLAAERGRIRAELEESRRQHATLIGNLPGMVYRCRPDRERTLLFVSEGCGAITRHTPEDLIQNRTVSFGELIHAEDRVRVHEVLAAAVAERRPYRLVYRLCAADGEERWVVEHGCGVETRGETVLEGFVHDVTELKRIEEQLVEAVHRAEEMGRLKSAFLANISHEIRTPLTSILGFASLLAEEVSDAQREFVCYIDRSGQRLLDTLNAMIDLSLIEAGSLDLHPQTVDLCQLAESVVDRMYAQAADKGLHLRFQADAPHVLLYLDAAFMERILQKLIDNAIKFTERGYVTVGVHRQPGHVEIRVEDTGIGIGESFLPHLFEAFKQESTGNARSHEGTGLGLALTKRLVDLLGGTIRVETQKGKGSTFTVAFPQVERTSSALPKRPGERRRGQAFGAEFQAHALIVDPSPFTQSYVSLLLGTWCAWTVAKDERTALYLLRRQHFDLVLLNIDFLESAGLETMERLRRASGDHPASVIAMTATPSAGEQGIIIDAGFDGYIGLPFTQQALARFAPNAPSA